MAKPRGRPTDCTNELVDEICEKIAISPKGIFALCKENPHWPNYRTIRRWISDDREDFSHHYALAKENQIHMMAEQILEIADDDSRDILINKDGNEVCNNAAVNRARLKIDARKWLASKLLPKVYGDKTIQESKVSVSYEEALKELE